MTVALRSPKVSSSTAATVTVRGVLQSVVVKVSDAGLTVTASVLDAPSAAFASGVTVTAPAGRRSSTSA